MIRDVDGQRYYAVPELGLVPSVSTVLRATAPRAWALETWRAHLGDETAELVTYIARERGKALHAKAEALLAHGVRPEGAEADVWWESIRPIVEHLARVGDLVMVEGAVWHPLDRYAGTPDMLIRICGDLHLVDYKSSAEPLPPARIEEHAQQLAGYADATPWTYAERPTDAHLVVAIGPDENGDPRPGQCIRVDLDTATLQWRERVRRFHGR